MGKEIHCHLSQKYFRLSIKSLQDWQKRKISNFEDVNLAERRSICLEHCVVKVHLIGFVVAVSRKQNITIFTLDDSSGLIDCVSWNEESTVKLGSRLKVCGDMKQRKADWDLLMDDYGSFPDIQLVVSSVTLVTDPNEEILHWAECAKLLEQTYSKPCLQLCSNEIQLLCQRINTELKRIRSHVIQKRAIEGKCNDIKVLKHSSRFSKRQIEAVLKHISSDYEAEVLVDDVLRYLVKYGYLSPCKDSTYFILLLHETFLAPRIIQVLSESRSKTGASFQQIYQLLSSSNRTKKTVISAKRVYFSNFYTLFWFLGCEVSHLALKFWGGFEVFRGQ